MNRRSFIASSTTVLASCAGGQRAASAAPGQASVVFRGADVYDGTGAPPLNLDVAVNGDRIAAVGPGLTTSGADVVDANGLALAPGFIDVHSHTDLVLLVNPNAESKIRQGVTTEVAGQDGSSIGPWSDDQLASVRDAYYTRYGVTIDFRDLAGFFERLEQTPASVNVASMIGAGTVRAAVVGEADRTASSEELSAMTDHVRVAMAAGACGLSSGLEYVPGAFADLEELITLCAPLRDAGLPYASHMRNEDDQLLAAIEEILNVGQRTGVSVHISHLKAQGERNWWKAESALDLIRDALDRGIDVTFDRYPYVAYSTGLSSLYPLWVREGGTDRFLARLRDPSQRSHIEQEVRGKIDQLGSWDAVQITSTGDDALAWARGRRLGELAEERAVEPYDLATRLITEDANNVGMVGFGMSEENTSRFLAHPLGMICSDAGARATYGPLSRGAPHPRAYGTFPRVLGHYCRDQSLMPLELAIFKMTGMPAKKLRFERRGQIRPGYAADLVVFDPATVADRATFENPHQYPVGVDYVMVNGTFVISRGEHTGARPGRIVRPTSLNN